MLAIFFNIKMRSYSSTWKQNASFPWDVVLCVTSSGPQAVVAKHTVSLDVWMERVVLEEAVYKIVTWDHTGPTALIRSFDKVQSGEIL